MGGGTPTTLSSAQMARLLEAVNRNFDLSRCLEFTVEGGRPDTLDPQKLRVIKDGGATRISINPQTMSDKVLETVGRRHTARQTVEAYEQAVKAGFDDINMDLIAGLPADDAAGFADSIRQVLDLNPSNITVHTLALKKGAALFGSRMELPPQEAVAAMLAGAEDALRQNGYERYLTKLTKKYHLTGKIICLGPLSAQQMKENYRNANVFVLPSTMENSPNSLGEAMLLGTPCVAAKVGGVASILDPEEGVLCPPVSPEALAEGICRVFALEDRAADLGEKARAHAQVTHDPKTNLETLLAIYRQLSEGA